MSCKPVRDLKMDLLEGVQRRALEAVRGHIASGERLEELGLCSLEKIQGSPYCGT